MQPQRISEPFVHETFIGVLDGVANHEHDIVQLRVTFWCPSAQINCEKSFAHEYQFGESLAHATCGGCAVGPAGAAVCPEPTGSARKVPVVFMRTIHRATSVIFDKLYR